jgi:hypothetical protein
MSTHKKSIFLMIVMLVIFGLIRFFLFERARSYEFYIKHSSVNEIGYRIRLGLYLDQFRLQKEILKQNIVPFGTSQTANIFKDEPNVTVFDFPGSIGFEYPYLIKSFFDRFKPQHISLFLSDIDLYFINHPGTLCDLPPRSLSKTSQMLDKMIDLGALKRFDAYYWRVWACDILPEYRYSAVIRALVTKALNIHTASKLTGQYLVHEDMSVFAEHEKRHPENHKMEIQKRLAVNLEGLDEFISQMEKRGVQVHIIQGSYNYSKIDISKVNGYIPSEEILKQLAGRHQNASYVDLQLGITDEDFVDPYHFKPVSAQRLRERMMQYFQANNWL